MSDLNIQITIALVIYFVLNLAILWLVHALTKKYNDK